MTIYILRHGKTEANNQKLYCGKTDVCLSEEGRKLLLKQKERYKDIKAQAYIISGLKRTSETLEILFGKQEYLIFPTFEEMNFGLFEMKSYEELKARDDYQRWINDIEHETCPLGESQPKFHKRVREGWNQLLELCNKELCNKELCNKELCNKELCNKELCNKEQNETVVLLTHGGVIAELMELIFQEGKTLYEWQPDFGEGYIIELDSEKRNFFKYAQSNRMENL